jgi:hypothetical protein
MPRIVFGPQSTAIVWSSGSWGATVAGLRLRGVLPRGLEVTKAHFFAAATGTARLYFDPLNQ